MQQRKIERQNLNMLILTFKQNMALRNLKLNPTKQKYVLNIN